MLQRVEGGANKKENIITGNTPSTALRQAQHRLTVKGLRGKNKI